MKRKYPGLRNERENMIYSIVPKEVIKILDIGCEYSMFQDKYDVKTLDFINNADIKQDLNKNQKLDLESNSFDMVVLNQILEHLPYVEKLVSESKRVSKRYIFIGLPNEITWTDRLRFLFGKPSWKGYDPFGHKHFFTTEEADKFVCKFFGSYICKKYWGAFTGTGLLPNWLRNFLARTSPSLFAKNIFYIVDLKKTKSGLD